MDAQEKMYFAIGVAFVALLVALLLAWLLYRSKRERKEFLDMIEQLEFEMDLKRLKEALGGAFKRYSSRQEDKAVVERFRYPLDNEKFDLPGLLPLAEEVYTKNEMTVGSFESFARFVYFLRGPEAKRQLETMLASTTIDDDWFHWTLELSGEKTIRSSLMS